MVPKVLPEIKTLKVKLERGAKCSIANSMGGVDIQNYSEHLVHGQALTSSF